MENLQKEKLTHKGLKFLPVLVISILGTAPEALSSSVVAKGKCGLLLDQNYSDRCSIIINKDSITFLPKSSMSAQRTHILGVAQTQLSSFFSQNFFQRTYPGGQAGAAVRLSVVMLSGFCM